MEVPVVSATSRSKGRVPAARTGRWHPYSQ